MKAVTTGAGSIHFRDEGPKDGRVVLFSNSLGTDLRVWDRVAPLLPAGLRVIRYDKRGHGPSDCPPRGTWGMGDHVADAAALLDALGVKGAVVVGLSVGGQIAQGLAAERPDLVHGMALCDTAAKIGAPSMWGERIQTIEADGLEGMADAVMERWFTKRFRTEKKAELRLWRNMLTRTSLDGYLGSCAAIGDADLRESTARLRLPTLAVCGDEDGSTPPDLVRETAALIPGAEFHLIPGAGHLPCVEQPEILATHLTQFMKRIGHV
ncbi:3-oxoadipate enol-lactonase [Pikeienuella piscinae]|uniref:3-oxoadipate enol-lactonase n=1 Tax=Pikeienuella piscinae TaxID=2748098 RepID=A0A7L5BXY9_9RHOB|nr:3-oxoadipate enol-lactonase [Pikeienuella piscinae]QIE55708.1 3-oxoadipate enol-lactonase [Pikeienuella piscinae]